MTESNYFNELNKIDVSAKVEKKNGLSYLSWAWAWAELKKRYPDSNYTIYEDSAGNFYHNDGHTCWVKVGVTVNGIEHREYLPVMDYRNTSIPVDKVTSFDVNKAIQRALTKAVARHGLGLYIYAGEDLPESAETATKAPETVKPTKTSKTPSEDKEKARESYNKLIAFCKENGYDIETVAKEYKLNANSSSNDFETVLHRLVLNDALNRAKEVMPEPEEV